MKRSFILAIAAVCNLAHADVLFINGPVVDANGKSILVAPDTAFGVGARLGTTTVADDFEITAGKSWNVTSIDFFAYQTNFQTFAFSKATWSIVKGDVNTGAVVASGTTAVTNGGKVGYRVTPSTLGNTVRPIFDLNADIDDTTLAAGHYWLRWSLTGSGNPLVAYTADSRAGNAAQSAGGAFRTHLDGGSSRTHELPFALNGNVVTAVPEPQTYALMLGGLVLLAGAARRRASKQA
ncbi:PEP-CTERM sorting domain-containing protein [Roseateles albus]|uniref:PEP-CTERM sorting domain-containing protein n=1 Tax=Roseateles albus TaxID=2987525 RepID=A0ABT5KD93_9BURK|nr:PEP-CTERM sorting domain-containing protein [Roseateles albus]MDC8771434.1 PEP-CTERM sorting domain-containing protein [Roseateles albus]